MTTRPPKGEEHNQSNGAPTNESGSKEGYTARSLETRDGSSDTTAMVEREAKGHRKKTEVRTDIPEDRDDDATTGEARENKQQSGHRRR